MPNRADCVCELTSDVLQRASTRVFVPPTRTRRNRSTPETSSRRPEGGSIALAPPAAPADQSRRSGLPVLPQCSTLRTVLSSHQRPTPCTPPVRAQEAGAGRSRGVAFPKCSHPAAPCSSLLVGACSDAGVTASVPQPARVETRAPGEVPARTGDSLPPSTQIRRTIPCSWRQPEPLAPWAYGMSPSRRSTRT